MHYYCSGMPLSQQLPRKSLYRPQFHTPLLFWYHFPFLTSQSSFLFLFNVIIITCSSHSSAPSTFIAENVEFIMPAAYLNISNGITEFDSSLAQRAYCFSNAGQGWREGGKLINCFYYFGTCSLNESTKVWRKHKSICRMQLCIAYSESIESVEKVGMELCQPELIIDYEISSLAN